jgi:hypothetical protein
MALKSKAAFLYEWLTGQKLVLKTAIGGAYVDVVNDRKIVAASPGQSTAIRRWRVRDNLPGTAAFCPIVRKTREWSDAVAVDVRRLLHDLQAEFGEEALLRSAAWMTLRENKASFAIEARLIKPIALNGLPMCSRGAPARGSCQ